MNRKDYAAIPQPTGENLLDCVNALKQTVEALIGVRGNSDSTAVTTATMPSSTLTLTGDVTGQGSGTVATTIAGHAVSVAKLAQVAANTILGNPTGATADVQAAALTAYLDVVSSTRGAVLYRGASGWAALPPDTTGKFLQSQGTGADPHYATVTIPSQPIFAYAKGQWDGGASVFAQLVGQNCTISRAAQGVWRVTFATPQPDLNYLVLAMYSYGSTYYAYTLETNRTVNSVDVDIVQNGTVGTQADATSANITTMNVICLR